MNRICILAILFMTTLLPLVSGTDTDGDGYDDDIDVFPDDDQQWNDTDEDGFGDNPVRPNGDGCPLEASVENQGCPKPTSISTDRIQGQFGTNGFNFAILISGFLGCILGVLYSRKNSQNSANSDQDIPLALFLMLMFVCAMVYTHPPLLSESSEKEYSNHDHAHVSVTGHDKNTGIEELDTDQNGITDGISVDYDVDYGGQETVPVEIQTDLTITDEEGVSMYLSQRRNITGTEVEEDTIFIVKPWSLGSYTAEIDVKVFGQDNEQNEDWTNFQQDEVQVLEVLDQPSISFSSKSQISEDEPCWVNLTAEDPLFGFWSADNQIQETLLTLVKPDSLAFTTNDWEEVNISCDDLTPGEYTFEFEIENTFQQQSEGQFILNITDSNESETNETNEINEANETNDTDESNSTDSEVIVELDFVIEVEIVDFCQLRFISDLQNSTVFVSIESKEINLSQSGKNVTFSCDDWNPRVYHLNISMSDGNGSEGWKNLTLVIPDPIILAFGTGSIVDAVQSEDAKLVFTYLAALSIFVTFSMAMIMAFFHSRMFGKESIKADYISDLATFRMNSKRRE